MSYQFKHLAKGGTVGSGSYVFRKYSEQVAPTEEYFLTFSSPNLFTLSNRTNAKSWDGTIEYSTDKTNWNTWSGTSAISSASDGTNYNLYVRGIGNTKITGNSNDYRWSLNGSNISCRGNIETLLDYATVELGNHPPMADACFRYLFQSCSTLTSPPSLPATTLSLRCYDSLFSFCSNLEILPALPATTLVTSCYGYMFSGCSKIKISETQTGEYINEYRIPKTGTGTGIGTGTTMMFFLTGGTFTGSPSINTTYYTSNEIV